MLSFIRIVFPVVCAVLGWFVGGGRYQSSWIGAALGLGIGLLLVLLEMLFTRRFITAVSVLVFGVIFGFAVAYLFIHMLYQIPFFQRMSEPDRDIFELITTFLFSFVAVMMILHARNDFKFVIPFIELSREGRMSRPLILDTSVIIDGRIADVARTGVIQTPLVIPRFVLSELQTVADSSDRLKRARGRRGLDILNEMRADRKLEIQINDTALQHIEGVDSKLVRLAKILDATLVTTDYNLNKVAQVQGVEVINLHDLVKSLRPVLLQGETLTLKIVKVGESPGQGVGYMDDGTMVVVEGCAGHVGQTVDAVVTNIYQTSAGRMIFAKPG